MTKEEAKDLSKFLPSDKFKKFRAANDEEIFDNAWDKVRGSNAISCKNPVLSKGVSFGPIIDSKLQILRDDIGL